MTTRFVTFSLDARLYGVRVESVQEVLRGLPRTRIPLATSTLAGLINLRGQVLSALDLREQLGLPPYAAEPDQMLVVIRVEGESVALLVDAIGAVVDVEDDQFEALPDNLHDSSRELLLGAYKLDHTLLLALDVDRAVAA